MEGMNLIRYLAVAMAARTCQDEEIPEDQIHEAVANRAQEFERLAQTVIMALDLEPGGAQTLVPKRPTAKMMAAGWRCLRRDPEALKEYIRTHKQAILGPGPSLSEAYEAMWKTYMKELTGQ